MGSATAATRTEEPVGRSTPHPPEPCAASQVAGRLAHGQHSVRLRATSRCPPGAAVRALAAGTKVERAPPVDRVDAVVPRHLAWGSEVVLRILDGAGAAPIQPRRDGRRALAGPVKAVKGLARVVTGVLRR